MEYSKQLEEALAKGRTSYDVKSPMGNDPKKIIEEAGLSLGFIEMIIAQQINGFLERYYNDKKKRRFKATYENEISDDYENRSHHDDDDAETYYARAEFPGELENTFNLKLSPKTFSKAFVRDALEDGELSRAQATAIASNKAILKYAGEVALKKIASKRWWEKKWSEGHLSSESQIAKQALDQAHRNTEVIMSSDDPESGGEIPISAYVEFSIKDYLPGATKEKVEYASPWKVKVAISLSLHAKFDWDY